MKDDQPNVRIINYKDEQPSKRKVIIYERMVTYLLIIHWLFIFYLTALEAFISY